MEPNFSPISGFSVPPARDRETTMNLSRTAFAAVLGFGLMAAAAPVSATGNFDGKWSVVVVTEKGDCDRAYRYPIDIKGQNLVNAGNASFDISGKVAGDG